MKKTSSKLMVILAAALLGAALLAPAANAGETVPPGNGEADQYAETVPGAGGNETPDGSQQPGDVLPGSQVEDLQNQGADGAGVAAFTGATAPGGQSGGGAGGSGSGSGDGSSQGSGTGGADGAPLAAAATTPVPGEDGLGPALWVIVALSAAGAIGFVAWRRWAQRDV